MLSLSLSRKCIAATALVIAAFSVASSAHARTDVTFSIGVQVPGAAVYGPPVYVHPRPVYVQPQPVYVRPHPAWVQQPPVYVVPRPVVIRPRMQGRHGGYGPGWKRGHWVGPAQHGHYDQRGHGGQHRGDRH